MGSTPTKTTSSVTKVNCVSEKYFSESPVSETRHRSDKHARKNKPLKSRTVEGQGFKSHSRVADMACYQQLYEVQDKSKDILSQRVDLKTILYELDVVTIKMRKVNHAM